MRKYFLLFFYNFLLIAVAFYIFFLSGKEIKMYNIPDLRNLYEEEGISLLSEFDIAINYVESDKEKNKILYTEPNHNQLIFKDQLIVLYVSRGNDPKYKKLKNQIYDDCKKYLEEIKTEYNLEIIVKYLENPDFPNGLIIEQNIPNEYISNSDIMELVVVTNSKTVILPEFIGWKAQEVLKYAKENKINVEFEYIDFLFEKDCVIGQSVKAGELVFKQGNPVIIYLAKEN